MVYEDDEDNDLNLLNLGHLVSKQLHVVNCLVSQVTLRAVVNKTYHQIIFISCMGHHYDQECDQDPRG